MKIKALIISLLVAITSFAQEDDKYFEISKNLSIFNDVYKNINLYYVDETQTGELMKTAIDAMLRSLDPYTNYIPESNIEDYRLMQTGQYGGIGSVISKKNDKIYISEPYENFPAQKAGLVAGDEIIKIDNKSIEGKNTQEVSELLKGNADTEVKISIKRGDETLEKTVTREVIKFPDIPYQGMLTDKIGYAKLSSFTNTSAKSVKNAFNELKDSNNMQYFILDLRGNPGGLLNQAVDIVNIFVEKGQEVVKTKGRAPQNNKTYSTQFQAQDIDMPIVVLIDGASASASEIVSGTLQDLDRAVVMGETSYGKGLVQNVRDIVYNGKVKVTIAKYYTPSGRCIQRLDYSNHEKTGNGKKIADSLITQFKTKNGRKVIDGRGIEPDIAVEPEDLSDIAINVLKNDFVFDYATQYYSRHQSVDEDFTISDSEYDKFVEYVLNQEFEYENESLYIIEDLKKAAKSEKTYADAENEFNELIKKLTPDKKRDLLKFKSQIKILLENEIISRYHYQNGRAVHSLKNDPLIDEAIKVLEDSELYKKTLQP